MPFFSLQLGASDPKGSTTRTGYDLIADGFGVGYNSTLEAVVSGPCYHGHGKGRRRRGGREVP